MHAAWELLDEEAVPAVAGGVPVAEACDRASADIRGLPGGHPGGVVSHALDSSGTPLVTNATPVQERVTCWFWDGLSRALQLREAGGRPEARLVRLQPLTNGPRSW